MVNVPSSPLTASIVPVNTAFPKVSQCIPLFAIYPEPSAANFIALTIPLVEYPVSGVILEGVDHAPYVLGGVTVLNLIHIC
jgi:hypothetical protein